MADSLAPLSVDYAGAAAITGISESSIRRAVRAGELVPVYPTTTPVLLVEELHEWLRRSPRDPDEARKRNRARAA
jgi:hypothetical protein